MHQKSSWLLLMVFVLAVNLHAQKVDKEGKTWLDQHTEPAQINVNGIWSSDDWGDVTLNQIEGSREVTGDGDGWRIDGVVSGSMVFLLFSNKGNVEYSAELVAEGGNKLTGAYTGKLMVERSKKKPMLLTK